MTRFILTVASILFPLVAYGNAGDLKKLKEAKIPESKNATCKTCHTQGKQLNAFGTAYKVADRDFKKMVKETGKE
ncbi:MAG: hypothetical protein A2428_03970 [Bdellovibrionales bacterium RIFOXYC1_FULL_54_43]|nr:MAG: hypothetical protein A2428_03970 [Bdellovibrionales bacterium RIFOXYC1_FULL_54_43]OFZ85679.1 MAG: hypothetical protein A2603_16805 [Bdellovibrionales bacterium RIFOXYD1_FULL_55_31]